MTTKAPTQATLDASSWLTKLRGANVTDADIAAFGDWLREAPVNVREYLETLVIWEQLGGVSPDIDVDALLAKTNVVPIAEHGPNSDAESNGSRSRARAQRRWSSVAALLAVAVIAGASWWSMRPATDIPVPVSTALGEQRSVALEDGSVIHLNTQSSVQVSLDDVRRYVVLLEGEAFFDIAKDPERPFIVDVGDTVIRVVGTRFNVRRLDHAATVTVVEGEVSVVQSGATAPPADVQLTLIPGQQATVGKAVERSEPVVVKVEKVVAWTERRLIFEGDTLRDIVAEFNRYNLARLVLEDDALGDKRLTGVFDANDIDSFIAILNVTQGITVIERPNGVRALVAQRNAAE